MITVGDTCADLGATVSDSGPGQAGDTDLGCQSFLNGTLVSNIVLGLLYVQNRRPMALSPRVRDAIVQRQ